MNTRKCLCLLAAIIFVIAACEKTERFAPNSDDSNPPGQVTKITYKALFGGARLYFTPPADEDLLSIQAVYKNAKGQPFTFAVSYFVDSIDVYGLADTTGTTLQVFAVDRAGNRSAPADVNVVPLQPAFTRVAESIVVKPGFSSFIVDWTNELQQNINVYVDFSYTQGGEKKSFSSVFSSNLATDRKFINDLFLGPNEPVNVKVRVEDIYGNITNDIDKGSIRLFEDSKIPKTNWVLPTPNQNVFGVPMCFGDGLEGRNRYVIDDIIDRGDNLNFMHTAGRGRTGNIANGNMPWNFIIDLGDYYDLSRIVTVQRHSGGIANVSRGQYYRSENVGIYNIYIWDEDISQWVQITQHKIPVPVGLSELEFVKAGEAGDMAYMYPQDPKYTKKTRWFRYEAVKGFSGNYTLDDANCLSEITLYGKKSN